MPRVYCTDCRVGNIKVPFSVLSVTFRCPRCNQVCVAVTEWERERQGEKAKTAASSPPVASALSDEVQESSASFAVTPTASPGIKQERVQTRLIKPHVCSQCSAAIREPLGIDRATLACPSCGNRTSLYAVMFRCSCGQMLEAPTGSEGSSQSCPACDREMQVPWMLVLLKPDEPPLEEWFSFECPECSDRVTARRIYAGQWSVCPLCHSPFEIPLAGEAVEETSVGERSPNELLQSGSELPCRGCSVILTTRAERCPLCGIENPTYFL